MLRGLNGSLYCKIPSRNMPFSLLSTSDSGNIKGDCIFKECSCSKDERNANLDNSDIFSLHLEALIIF